MAADSEDGFASPSYDLYSDLLVEDAEASRRETRAAASSCAEEALRAEVASLKAANAALTERNADLTSRLEKAESSEAAMQRKFLAFRQTASEELKKKHKELQETQKELYQEKSYSRRLRFQLWERNDRREVIIN